MPNYNPAATRSLWPGAQETLADSTLASPYSTVAIAPGPDPSGNPRSVTFFNSTDQSATIQAANVDADGNYVSYSTVGAGSAAVVPVGNVPFLRALMAGAPTTGSLVVVG